MFAREFPEAVIPSICPVGAILILQRPIQRMGDVVVAGVTGAQKYSESMQAPHSEILNPRTKRKRRHLTGDQRVTGAEGE